jgi:hypothetical protein
MEGIIGILLPIIISLGVFTMIVLLRRMEHLEKLKMIEKGIDVGTHQKPKRPGVAIKIALIAVGVGIGLLVGNILDAYTPLQDEVCYFSMIFLFAGVGLFTANKIVENKEKEQEMS